jgi:hypothetical protein
LVELTNLWIYSVYIRHAYYIYIYMLQAWSQLCSGWSLLVTKKWWGTEPLGFCGTLWECLPSINACDVWPHTWCCYPSQTGMQATSIVQKQCTYFSYHSHALKRKVWNMYAVENRIYFTTLL